MSQELQKFYVVRGYDKDGKQFGESKKCADNLDASMAASSLLLHGCKSVDIDLIESPDAGECGI